jgi:hypothetical protein
MSPGTLGGFPDSPASELRRASSPSLDAIIAPSALLLAAALAAAAWPAVRASRTSPMTVLRIE